MSIESDPPTLPRRVLGRRLREMREVAGLTRAKAARKCEMGAQTLWRLETGRNSEAKKITVNALCDAYATSDEERRELLWLVDESRKDGWWQSSADAVAPKAEVFLGLEREARTIFSWQTMTLPGLIQTPAYRRAMWKAFEPLGNTINPEHEILLLEERQKRLLDRTGFTLDVALSEAAVRYRICDPDAMAAQFDHLVALCTQPNISLRIVPFEAPPHLGLKSKNFVYLEFPEHLNPLLTEPPVVYVEGLTGSLYLDKPGEIEQYEKTRRSILEVALDQDDTVRLLEATAREYRYEHRPIRSSMVQEQPQHHR